MTNTSAASQIDLFFRQFQPFRFHAQDVIVRTGEKTPVIYYVTSGVISQTSTSPKGQEINITMYKPGSFFPLIWAIKDTPLPYDLRAISDGEGWKAPREDVIHFLKHNAEVSFDLVTRLLSGLEGLSRKLEFSLHSTATQRVCEALLTLAYRFGAQHETGTQIELQLTHQQLADVTGLTRETITRELKFLREQHLIEGHEQMFKIPDLAALEAATHS